MLIPRVRRRSERTRGEHCVAADRVRTGSTGRSAGHADAAGPVARLDAGPSRSGRRRSEATDPARAWSGRRPPPGALGAPDATPSPESGDGVSCFGGGLGSPVNVLVLNASYEPLHKVDVRHAVRMLVRGVAVVEEAVEGRNIGHFPFPRV